MAQKRMFDKTVIRRDDFIEMPDSCQNLYFHLSMDADDDGFVDNWKSIMRMTGKKEDDMKILISKKFVIPFDTGVIVIKHWKLNNYLRGDRYKETKYLEEKSKLYISDNQEYTLDNDLVYQLATSGVRSIEESSIEEKSIGEVRIGQERTGEPAVFKKIGLYTNETLSAEAQLKLDTYQEFIRELIKDNQFEIINKITINILEKSYSKCKNKTNIINYLKAYVIKELGL